MALFPLNDLLTGTKRLFAGLQAKKSNGTYEDLKTNDLGSLNVAPTAFTLSSVVTMQNAATATGNGTSLITSGMGVALLAVSGTFTATITFEGQVPDGNWYAVNALNRGTGLISTTATSPGLYEINVRGLTAIRARISSYTSGSVTVKGQAQPLPVENGFVQLTGRKAKVQAGNYDQVLNVGAGSATTITITPPTGELWRIKNLYLSIPAPTGAIAGTHTLSVGVNSFNSGRYFFLQAKSNHADIIRIRNGAFDVATNSKSPSSEQAILQQIQALTVTNESPLIIYYENQTTGGTQTGTILISIVREVEYVL